MKKQKPTSQKTKIQDLTHDTIPATVGLVKEVRDELRADIRSVDHRLESIDHKLESIDHKFESVDHRFESIDRRFESIDHKFESMDHKIDSLDHKIESVDQKVESLRSDLKSIDHKVESFRHELKSDIEKVIVSVHRTQVLMEEQRGENRIVLDGIKTMMDRQERLETNFNEQSV